MFMMGSPGTYARHVQGISHGSSEFTHSVIVIGEAKALRGGLSVAVVQLPHQLLFWDVRHTPVMLYIAVLFGLEKDDTFVGDVVVMGTKPALSCNANFAI